MYGEAREELYKHGAAVPPLLFPGFPSAAGIRMLQPALILALVPRREARPQYARSDTVARHTLGSALESAAAA